MESNIKIMTELEKLLKTVTSNTAIKPDVAKYHRIAQLLNSKTNIPKEFVKRLKTKLATAKHPKSQYLILDLIEYTTCKCTIHLHNEYNSKVFLQQINAIFNKRNLVDNVRNKALFLVQFWNNYFMDKSDILNNFGQYYTSIVKKGISFPDKRNSDYHNINEAPVKGIEIQDNTRNNVNVERGNSGSNNFDQGNTDQKAEMDTSEFTDKQKKLFKDLNVVAENVGLANSMLDREEYDGLQEIMENVFTMESKLKMLPAKLQKAGEDFLYSFSNALLADIASTRDRCSSLQNGMGSGHFQSRTQQVIRNYSKQDEKQETPDEDDDQFGFTNQPSKQKLSSGDQFGSFEKPNNSGSNNQFDQSSPTRNQNTGFGGNEGFGVPQQTNEVVFGDNDDWGNQPSNNTGFGGNDGWGQSQQTNNPFGQPTNNYNFGDIQATQPNTQPVNDLDLLDMDNPTPAPNTNNTQNQGFGNNFNMQEPKSTPFDLDFTSQQNQAPVNVETAFGMQIGSKQHNPQGNIKFEKEAKKIPGVDTEYDPFGQIGGFGGNKNSSNDGDFLF
jgi:hypothetical protein